MYKNNIFENVYNICILCSTNVCNKVICCNTFVYYTNINFYRKCPSDLMVYLTKKIINNLRVKWAAEPKLFGYRPEKKGLYIFIKFKYNTLLLYCMLLIF